MIHTYEVSGMHCQSCIGKITTALKSVPNVRSASVKLNPPEAIVEMSAHIATEALNRAVEQAGAFNLKDKPNLPVSAASSPSTSASVSASGETDQSLIPLFIIVGYIVGGVLLRAVISQNYALHTLMNNFMGGFFVVFSLFKMFNLSGFADGYSTYDLIAKHSRGYALSYPFIELTLGIAYFTGFALTLVNVITLILMVIGSIGVTQALLKKQAIQCVCLGTSLKLPMTIITLVEDATMGLMALLMLGVV